MTTIYYASINEERHALLLKDALPGFPVKYQEKITKFIRWQDAQLSLLGRLLLEYGLKIIDKQRDVNKINFNASAKPYFAFDGLYFNISHSGNITICAISDQCEIGIDIELVKEIQIDHYKEQMTQNEWTSISNSEDTNLAFFDYWTQKEAVLKAHGSGMNIPLKSFEIKKNSTRITNEDFYLKEIPLNADYRCHLAFKGQIDPDISGPLRIDGIELF